MTYCIQRVYRAYSDAYIGHPQDVLGEIQNSRPACTASTSLPMLSGTKTYSQVNHILQHRAPAVLEE